MKLIYSLLVFSLVWSLSAVAAPTVEGQDRGGGDACENRVQVIRNDLRSWILNGGHKNLILPQGLTHDHYSEQILEASKSVRINCIGKGDPEFPLRIGDVSKTCVFTQSLNLLTCDREIFNSTTEEAQYILIHHEFAGLADIEPPNGEESKYEISNQISMYLENQLVKKLAVKPGFVPSRSALEQLPRLKVAVAKTLNKSGQWEDLLISCSDMRCAVTVGPVQTLALTSFACSFNYSAQAVNCQQDFLSGLANNRPTALFALSLRLENQRLSFVASTKQKLAGKGPKNEDRFDIRDEAATQSLCVFEVPAGSVWLTGSAPVIISSDGTRTLPCGGQNDRTARAQDVLEGPYRIKCDSSSGHFEMMVSAPRATGLFSTFGYQGFTQEFKIFLRTTAQDQNGQNLAEVSKYLRRQTRTFDPNLTIEVNIEFIDELIWRSGYSLLYNDGTRRLRTFVTPSGRLSVSMEKMVMPRPAAFYADTISPEPLSVFEPFAIEECSASSE